MTTRKEWGDILITNDGASLSLSKRHSSYYIQTFLAQVPNKGYGRKLMNRVVSFAKKRNHRLTLHVGKFKPWGMSNEQLAAFYSSFGFRFKDGDPHFMEFVP